MYLMRVWDESVGREKDGCPGEPKSEKHRRRRRSSNNNKVNVPTF